MIQNKILEGLTRTRILKEHKESSLIIRAYPTFLEKAKKYGWKKNTHIIATVRVKQGNPKPILPVRGRKAYYATMTRKINKSTIACARAEKKLVGIKSTGCYQLASNSIYTIFEIILKR